MPHEVIMPALGMAQETGLIVSWLKAPGDPVAVGEPLMEVETDKATMEVEAQADGWLAEIRAVAGQSVPVGDVVAVISDTAGGAEAPSRAALASPPAADAPAEDAPAENALPAGARVIMPALGMAQDTGLLVAWHRAPGEAVAAEDVLLEVETDKSTMEVAAGHSGHVAALLAEAGETVPVGTVIAVISAAKPTAPLARRADAALPPPAASPSASPAASAASLAVRPASPGASPAPRPAPPPAPPSATAPAATKGRVAPRPASGLRVLASPKARRLAAEAGLDLARLVASGVPQPYHVADLETLKRLAAEGPATAAAASARHLAARVPARGLDDFLAWIGAETGAPAAPALVLAAMAASALRTAVAEPALVIVTESAGQSRRLADPDLAGMVEAAPTSAAERRRRRETAAQTATPPKRRP